MADNLVTEEKQEMSQEELEQKFVQCPCCGQFTMRKPLKPNDRLVDHWLACMVSATPFSHTYPIYDGKINITVTQLSPDIDDKVTAMTAALDSLKSKDWEELKVGINLSNMLGAVRLFSIIPEITVFVKNNTNVYKPQEVVLGCYEDLMKAKHSNNDKETCLELLGKCYRQLTDQALVSALPFHILLATCETHTRLSVILQELGFDSNFWEGIKLV